jgi:hypothetical protein
MIQIPEEDELGCPLWNVLFDEQLVRTNPEFLNNHSVMNEATKVR